MKKLTISISFDEYDSLEELQADDRLLLEKALEATGTSYAPYSNFQVGAALRLAGGEIITGSNQENVAYPSGLCAERVALFHAQSAFPGIPAESMAIAARSADFEITNPLTPCGSCRQVISEHENRHGARLRIIISGAAGKVWIIDGIKNLLPLEFKAEQLKKTRR